MFKIIIDFFLAIILCTIFCILKIFGKEISAKLCALAFPLFGKLTKFEKIEKKNISYVWPKKKIMKLKKLQI